MTARNGCDDLVTNFVHMNVHAFLDWCVCLYCSVLCVSACVYVCVCIYIYSSKGQKAFCFSTSRLMRVWGQTASRQSWPRYSISLSLKQTQPLTFKQKKVVACRTVVVALQHNATHENCRHKNI